MFQIFFCTQILFYVLLIGRTTCVHFPWRIISCCLHIMAVIWLHLDRAKAINRTASSRLLGLSSNQYQSNVLIKTVGTMTTGVVRIKCHGLMISNYHSWSIIIKIHFTCVKNTSYQNYVKDTELPHRIMKVILKYLTLAKI